MVPINLRKIRKRQRCQAAKGPTTVQLPSWRRNFSNHVTSPPGPALFRTMQCACLQQYCFMRHATNDSVTCRWHTQVAMVSMRAYPLRMPAPGVLTRS